MRLNSNKFLLVLKNLDDLSFFKNRKWDKVYSNNTVSYLNYEIWKNILNNENINGEAIDKYEFNNFCKYYLTDNEINILFNRINKKSRCINFDEFNEFLEFLSEKDYLLCINCLEPEVDPQTPEVDPDVEDEGDLQTPKEETEGDPHGDPQTPEGDLQTPKKEPKGDPETPKEEHEPEKTGFIKKLHNINNFFKNKISIFFNIFK